MYKEYRVCQRPERAFFISTNKQVSVTPQYEDMCQRPERAFFISTLRVYILHAVKGCVSTP